MEKVKRIKLFCVGIIIVTIILITIGTIFFIRKINKPRNVVLPAISEAMAQGMVKENEIYIVRVANPDEFGTGGWYYIDGEEKIKMMLAEGNLSHELSDIFLDPDRNSFLVKGKINEELTQYNGCLTLDVESWYLIAPIKRDYGPREYRKEQRFFYPKDYLDVYDLEQGDYTPVEKQE